MKHFKKLIGDRIYLSPISFSEDAVEQFAEWLNDFNVTDYTGRSGKILTLEQEREYFEKSCKSTGNIYFDIVTLEGDKLIGRISLNGIEWIPRIATMGIFIGDENFRNNGYGTEAIRLLLEYGFKYLNLHNIRLSLIDVNERAHKSYLKCGFKDTGRHREIIFVNGKYHDMLYMDILESEFSGDFIRNKNL